MTQYHQCSFGNCLRAIRGRTVCKRRAPFPLAEDDWVDGDGHWGPRRLCELLNGWNPAVLRTIHANHDTKIIMSGGDTNILTWYITNYVAKKQNRSSNVSALLAKRVAFHNKDERQRKDLTDTNKRLIQRCANTLARDREFSGPEIMSYLMGWGDRFESHFYVGISADAIMTVLKEQYPGLRVTRCVPAPADATASTSASSESSSGPTAEGINDRCHTIVVVPGSIALRDQLLEYAFRGDEMIEMSYLDFMLDTYDAKMDEIEMCPTATISPEDGAENDRWVGRTRNQRVPYRQGFTRPGQCRIFRTCGHETLPHFLGGWFPRNDREKERELYCASMLTLLKPWTDLSHLKTDAESFGHVFDTFMNAAPKKTKDIIENIQYYYECYDGTKSRRDEDMTEPAPDVMPEIEVVDGDDDLPHGSIDGCPVPEIADVTVEDIELAYMCRGTMRERLHAEVALNTAFDYSIFPDELTHTTFLPPVMRADTEDLRMIHE